MGRKVREQKVPSTNSHIPYLNNSFDINCSIETHEVHRQLLKFVCPVFVLFYVPLQV